MQGGRINRCAVYARITSGQTRAQKIIHENIIAARRQNQVSSGAQASSGIGKRPTVIEREATQRIRDCSSSRNVSTSKPLAVTATVCSLRGEFYRG